MPINLVKGQNHVLNMNIFHVGLGWDVNEDASSDDDFDLDISAFMVNDTHKIPADDYLVFYNSEKRLKVYLDGKNKGKLVEPRKIYPYTAWATNDEMRAQSRPVDPEMSVIGSIDDEDGSTSESGDDETMDIDHSKVRNDIQEIIITVSIHKYKERKQNFGQVERAYVRLYKQGQEAEGQGEFVYDLTEDFSACASVEFCRLYRRNNDWKIQATGIGHHGGLEELVEKYT